ncbi:MAG: glycoside hydrolase family 127 protein [Fimbriimonas sp.]|nr:glycoside hydrolase family 127 protein [Fimbriimonas sp.]
MILSLAAFIVAAGYPFKQGETRVMKAVPIKQVKIDDDFWAPKMKVWREVTIPDCFTKFEKDGALANFDKISSGAGGEHGGPPWYDGLIYEMIRGSADFLAAKPDSKLESQIDSYIERIAAAAARDPDGYLNTYTQLKEPTHRWGRNGGNDRWQHDLYNAGALVEAAVHYYRATGKTRLLEVATRMANLMASTMGPPPKWNVVPGHALGEESLVRLYQLYQEHPDLKKRLRVQVHEADYLHLAEFWIDARGHHDGREDFGAYDQDEIPVVEQQTIEGHAVRAMLLCCGLVAAGDAAQRPELLVAAKRLWENMVTRRMYLTGGVGAESNDEKFGADFYLPNTGYAETCASVAAAFFHHEMNLQFGEATYADELERVLYNGLLAGVSLKGDTYFYENPLEAGKQRTRWHWHGCPCCPPMFLKAMGALPSYIYAQDDDNIYANLYIGSLAHVKLKDASVELRQTTEYPWHGKVVIHVHPASPSRFGLNLRLPSWCLHPQIHVNGQRVAESVRLRGYASIVRKWEKGDEVELELPMPVQRMHADPRVDADRGRVALQRGPLVYCLEGVDNGGHLSGLLLPSSAFLADEQRKDLLDGVTVIQADADRLGNAPEGSNLYRAGDTGPIHQRLTAIPYFANANRSPSEMMVWIPDTNATAKLPPPPSLATHAKPSTSHCFNLDTVAALNDGLEPAASDDESIPRFTWWDHRGTNEWVQYDFDHVQQVRSVDVYWWDERRIHRECRVPQTWRVLVKSGDEWKPVEGAIAYGTELDRFNHVTFKPTQTTAIRLEVQLQPDWSAGILEWRVN